MASRKTTLKHIITIGGGTGSFIVLSALRDYPVRLSSIVSMADSGGSTGKLRDQYGVLPPGDIRRSLVALSDAGQTLRDLFNYRFRTGDFTEHNFGNIFLSVLEKITGSFDKAVTEASRVLNIKGEVIPVTLDNVHLCARLASGLVIKGEANIDVPKHNPEIPIEDIWLSPKAKANPQAVRVIMSADMIVIGPGDLYSSIIPNFLVGGIGTALKRSRAKKIYCCNLMTKFGETHGFKAQNFVDAIEKYIGRNVLDYAVFNGKKPPPRVLKHYLEENSRFVDVSGLDLKREKPKYILADLLDSGEFIRHNPRKKLAKVLMRLL
jgi:uncharacterized cofD-like protein